MKKHINNLKDKFVSLFSRAQMQIGQTAAARKLQETKGDFVMNHAVVFIIVIVLAALAITLLIAYMNTDLSAMLKDKVSDLFN